MKIEDQILHIAKFQQKQQDTLLKKGNDYAGDDRLSNFKTVAAITNTTPEMVCLTMIGIKVARLGQLLSGKQAENESVRDSVEDLANYSILLDQILMKN